MLIALKNFTWYNRETKNVDSFKKGQEVDGFSEAEIDEAVKKSLIEIKAEVKTEAKSTK